MAATPTTQALGSRLGFVTGGYYSLDPLPTVANFTKTSGDVLVSRPQQMSGSRYRLQRAAECSALVLDPGSWTRRHATAAEPLALRDDGLIALDLPEWIDQLARCDNAEAVLTPSYHVHAGDWTALEALLRATDIDHPRSVTLIPTDAKVLEPSLLNTFLQILSAGADRRYAFIFTDPNKPFMTKRVERTQRILGLRALLQEHHGAWLLNVDPLMATDALAHGAGFVGVGVNSGGRHPSSPSDPPPPLRAAGTGVFARSLLEFRSSPIYAAWHEEMAAAEYCPVCDRTITEFHSVNDAHRLALLFHNLHAIHTFVYDLMGDHFDVSQDQWLNDERCRALALHTELRPQEKVVQADRTLRTLCEIDDPLCRSTTPQGAWSQGRR